MPRVVFSMKRSPLRLTNHRKSALGRIAKISLVVAMVIAFIIGLIGGFQLMTLTQGKVSISEKIVAYPIEEYIGNNCTSGTLTAHFYYSNSTSYFIPNSAGYYNGKVSSTVTTNTTTLTTCETSTTK